MLGAVIPAVEKRLAVNILLAGGLITRNRRPEVGQINYIHRITIPILMLNRLYDTFYIYETPITPKFDLL